MKCDVQGTTVQGQRFVAPVHMAVDRLYIPLVPYEQD